MKTLSPRAITLIVMVALLVASQASAIACPSCYGAPDSPMTKGMNTAIIVMLGITGFVLASISAFFVMMRRRFKHYQNISTEQTFVNEKGVLRWNNY